MSIPVEGLDAWMTPYLLDQGVIERIGSGRGVRFILSRKFRSFQGKPRSYTRDAGLDRETNKDLEQLVAEARAKGSASWSIEEKRMASIVAKAWVLLAPLGIETTDIRRLVNKAVRNAWK